MRTVKYRSKIIMQGKAAMIAFSIAIALFFCNGLYPQNLKSPHTTHSQDPGAIFHYDKYLEHKNSGDYARAIQSLHLFEEVIDSLDQIDKAVKLSEMRTRYENDKKEQEINLLIQDNKFKELKIKENRLKIIVTTGLVILLAIIIALSIRQAKLRADQRALSLEQTLLRAQMNPHFIFNTLTNIQSFVIRKEQEMSLKYLDYFSDLIGSILDSSGKKLIPLETEIKTIIDYLSLQRLRFGDELIYSIETDPGIRTSEVFLPPMMVQPLLENAIEHGLKPKAEQGEVMIRFLEREGNLVIEVQDNGVGRDISELHRGRAQSHHAGLALKILEERINSLSHARKRDTGMDIIDLKDEKSLAAGTLVRLTLPLFNNITKFDMTTY